jgi:malonate-semialdehyde dehydrogenase (acetylating)/methylmalonate-semialdehyde dehydrogenase
VTEGATLVVDGRGCKVAGFEGALSPAYAVRPRHAARNVCIYKGRDFLARCSAWFAYRLLLRSVDLVNGHEFGNGVACFTSAMANVARRNSARAVNGGGVQGINAYHPGPNGMARFWWLEEEPVRVTHARLRREEGVRFYNKQTVMQRYPLPASLKAREFVIDREAAG